MRKLTGSFILGALCATLVALVIVRPFREQPIMYALVSGGSEFYPIVTVYNGRYHYAFELELQRAHELTLQQIRVHRFPQVPDELDLYLIHSSIGPKPIFVELWDDDHIFYEYKD